MFMHLQTLKAYILPDNYEVVDSTLNSIKYVISPTFTEDYVHQLDSVSNVSYDLHNKPFIPGFIGLNNIKDNDYINVIVQGLAHVKLIRDYFLLNASQKDASELVKRFGVLIRKIWSSNAFKGQVSPHELIQEVSNESQKRFKLGKQSDPTEFLAWFMNSLNNGMKLISSEDTIFQETFQGEMIVETFPPTFKPEAQTTDNGKCK